MKKALVSGGSSGIGAAIALSLAADGMNVTVNYSKSHNEALSIAELCGGAAFRADVADSAQVRHMYDEIGGQDVLVCSAGISEYGLFSDISGESWDRLFAVNVGGVKNCIQAALPYMIHQKRGCIVIISSVWGIYGAACEAAYSASKAALIGLTKALAKELGPSGIRVNCVAPGVIETPMLGGFSDEDKRILAEETPLGRLGTPEDVANLVSFLCSDRAEFVTGQIIGVDGGFGM